jgi:hypothetical protein
MFSGEYSVAVNDEACFARTLPPSPRLWRTRRRPSAGLVEASAVADPSVRQDGARSVRDGIPKTEQRGPICVSSKRTQFFCDEKHGLSACTTGVSAGKMKENNLGSFWKTNPFLGGILEAVDGFAAGVQRAASRCARLWRTRFRKSRNGDLALAGTAEWGATGGTPIVFGMGSAGTGVTGL